MSVLHFFLTLYVFNTVPSKIDEFRTNIKPRTIINSPLTIACPASGIPPPVITWYKDGNVVDFSKDENIQLDKDGQELTIKVTEVKHTGTYSCEAANEAGTSKLDFDVFVEGQIQSFAHCQISSSVYPETR